MVVGPEHVALGIEQRGLGRLESHLGVAVVARDALADQRVLRRGEAEHRHHEQQHQHDDQREATRGAHRPVHGAASRWLLRSATVKLTTRRSRPSAAGRKRAAGNSGPRG